MRRLDTFILAETVLHSFVDRATETHEKFIAGLSSDLFENHKAKPASVLQRTAIVIGSVVHGGREKLSDKMRISERFDAVEATFFASTRCCTISFDNAGDVAVIHLLWKASM